MVGVLDEYLNAFHKYLALLFATKPKRFDRSALASLRWNPSILAARDVKNW